MKTFEITPDLVMKVGRKTYRVPPPSRDNGLIMQALNVAGVAVGMAIGEACPTCGRSEEIKVDPKYEALVEANKDKDLGELSLGPAYQKMLDDGLDAATLSRVEMYAFYYWTLGEATADGIMEQAGISTHASNHVPKGRKPSKNGQRMG